MKLKLKIEPRNATWNEAKQIAHESGGRLVYPKEALTWMNREVIEHDFWLNDENANDKASAQYLDAKKQSLMYKPKETRMLLVYLYEPEVVKKNKEAQQAIEQKQEAMRKRARDKR